MNKLAEIRRRTGPFGAIVVTAYMVLGSYGILQTFHNFGMLVGAVLLVVSLVTAFAPAAMAGAIYTLQYIF
jgi:hypothetical protein